MNQKSIAIVAILAATILTAVFTTAPPFSLKSAEGQTSGCPVGYHRNILGICVPDVAQCPVGYERSSSGLCVPITRPPPDTLPTRENRTEQNIVCSGWSYTCG
ncbi:MAG: hypothetical protein ACR2IS_00335 [Nitrososphaeraceae archaeon]